MEYSYRRPEFYVRECYATYYDEILRLLSRKHLEVVTVTGTPGIGKSMFFAYFLWRYSQEHPQHHNRHRLIHEASKDDEGCCVGARESCSIATSSLSW